ncbi:MAG: hypothetical protein HY686_01510 [Chloroflexi bacterium]|nr:hypothetical protein [Chloroflexota bacterium]
MGHGSLFRLALGSIVALLLVYAPPAAVSAHGTNITAVPLMASGYKYKVVGSGAEPGFEQPAYDDSSFSIGDAAFGTTVGCSFNNPAQVKSYWQPNTDLLLRKEFALPVGAHNLRVQGTVDNDATVFINGQQIGAVASGFCISPNIDFTAPDTALATGINLLAVRGHDYGGATYLDVTVTFDVVVLDNTPPTVTCSVTPDKLWPPNHKMRTVSVSVSVDDTGSGPAGYTLVSVTSNEPDNGLGDGDVANDIQGFVVGTPDTSGDLRAERSGKGSGRVYTLTYQGMDQAGNSALCSTTVSVPHDQS